MKSTRGSEVASKKALHAAGRAGRLRKRFKEQILKRYFIRFHMGLMVTAVTVSGVLMSKLLLELGVTAVLWRYPLAVAGSFLVFLVLVRVWLWYVMFPRSSTGVGTPDLDEAGDLLDYIPDIAAGPSSETGFSGYDGGDSGGGGASDVWSAVASDAGGGAAQPSSGGGSWLPFDLDFDLDLDDAWWIVLLFAILILVIFGGAAYLVYFAPEILPEVAMQAVLASSLHQVSKKMEREGWVAGIVKSTCLPFLLVMAMAAALAYAVHQHCPDAVKMIDALRCSNAQ